jgi:GDP/UDP-N,N'-diacetylbacillosamine 2-epimerase (hydrolysing)
MRIAILTSSRADLGIYKVLIEELISDNSIELEVVAFGTHMSYYHGYTLDSIIDKYKVNVHEVCSLLISDNEVSTASSFGLTALKFSDFWNVNKYHLVFCLGDRFEMCAAVLAGIPFGINFAHIHGGETTMGAIDNVYRHQISLACNLHFTSTEPYKQRVAAIIGSERNIFNVGSLSISGIKQFKPYEKNRFLLKFNIINQPFCLVTFHSETRALGQNKGMAMEMTYALSELCRRINLVITMPNADTYGSVYRKQLLSLKKENDKQVFIVENFGEGNYFSAMYHAQFILGNSSSGIIEAASFGKYVVNVGGRQEGRAQSKNILNVEFNKHDILKACFKCIELGEYRGGNIYYNEDTVEKIMNTIKKENAVL